MAMGENTQYKSERKSEQDIFFSDKEWRSVGDAHNAIAFSATLGKLYAVSKERKLWKRDAVPHRATWQEIMGPENPVSIAAIRGRLFVATRDNNIWTRSGNTTRWRRISDVLNAKTLAAIQGRLFAVTTDSRLFQLDEIHINGRWQLLDTVCDATSIAGIGGKLYGITTDRKLIVWDAIASHWREVSDSGDIIALTATDGILFGITSNNELLTKPLEIESYTPGIPFPGVFIKDLPTPWQPLFTPKKTDRRNTPRLETLSQPVFANIIGNYRKISRIGKSKKVALVKAQEVEKAYTRSVVKRLKTVAGPSSLPSPPQDADVLRVLIFDKPIPLTQELQHEGDSYYLDNPPFMGGDSLNKYSGYIVVADHISLGENIETKGNDLILVAKTIEVSASVDQVTLSTRPPDKGKAPVDEDGMDNENGGDLVFLTQHIAGTSKIRIVTSGGDGQSGGDGRPATDPPVVSVQEEVGTTQAFGLGMYNSPWGGLTGSIISLQPSRCFYDNPSYPTCHFLCPHDDPPGSASHSVVVPSPLPGKYGIYGTLDNGAVLTTLRVRIDPEYYPTPGRSGGYGGLPGKVTLIIPEIPERLDFTISAETGADGTPGKVGRGGEIKPQTISPDPFPYTVPTEEYIRRNTWEKITRTELPLHHRLGHVPRQIGEQHYNFAFSFWFIEFRGAMRVLYYRTLKLKTQDDPSTLTEYYPVWAIMKNITLTWIAPYRTLTRMDCSNIVPYWQEKNYPWPSTLGISLYGGSDGEPLPPLQKVTEDLRTLAIDWYKSVYDLVPEYPERLYRRADKLYRSGEFTSALPFYQDVLAFSQMSPFDNQDIIADANYRIRIGSLGLDYFGFRPNLLIPVSPSREIDLITRYSDTVKFFNESIYQVRDSLNRNQQFIDLLNEFSRQHEQVMEKIKDEITLTEVEIVAISLEIKQDQHEIEAMLQANIRMGNILLVWAQRVNDKIAELEAQEIEEVSEWLEMWHIFKLFAAICITIYTWGAAVASLIKASDELAEYESQVSVLLEEENHTVDAEVIEIDRSSTSFLQELEYLKDIGQILSKFKDDMNKAIRSTTDLSNQLKALNAGSNQWTEQEAQDFKNDVLLAEEIGVSGGMTYLQIQEQMVLNDDLLIGKQLELDAAYIRREMQLEHLDALVQQFALQELNRQYLQSVIDSVDQIDREISSVIDQLTRIGQGDLDALLTRLQTTQFQMKFLELNTALTIGRYDKFIENMTDVASVLQDELALRQRIAAWINANSNLGRLKIFISSTDLSAIGNLVLMRPNEIETFSTGEYIRPSFIIQIEPIREVRETQALGDAIRSRLGNPTKLAEFLMGQFPISDPIEDAQMLENIKRERSHFSLLDSSPVGSLTDREILLAYACAVGGITSPILADLLTQRSLSGSLWTSLSKISMIWNELAPQIINEDTMSLRVVTEMLRQELGTPPRVVDVLNKVLTKSGSTVELSRFHLNSDDILKEIETSHDPDFPDCEVLATIHNHNDINVVLAIILLYAGFDSEHLTTVASQYSVNHPIGERLKSLIPEWENLRRSILEKQHIIKISVLRDQLLDLPNISGTYEHRILGARAALESGGHLLPLSLILQKLPPDLFEKEGGGNLVELILPIENKIIFPDAIGTPSSFVIDDYHYDALFGRSVLGDWELMITNKGDQPSLPIINMIHLEFIYSYRR